MLLRHLKIILYFSALLCACYPFRIEDKTNEMKNNNLRIYFVTFNVNSKEPINLEGLLDLETYRDIDLYAISLQEMPFTSLFADVWRKALKHVLLREGFVLLRGETLTVTSLMLFVRKEKLVEYYDVDKSYVNFNLLYRKGGVGIRFFWRHFTFCFIGAHLLPHDHNYEKRNANYHYILDNLRFKAKDVLAHDFVFLLGDLNYRLNTINTSEIKQFIVDAQNDNREDRFQNLLAYDQLILARNTQAAFGEFSEALINFPPTFKFIVGSQIYNEQRKPAYTDRILFRNGMEPDPSAFIDCYAYTSLPELKISDHKPVRLVVNIPGAAYVQKFNKIQAIKSENKRQKRSFVQSSSGTTSQQTDSGTPMYSEVPEGNLIDLNDEGEIYNMVEADEGTKLSRTLRIIFDPVQGWIENRPQTIRFRIVHSETGEPIQPYPELFRGALCEWDYVGLLREDWSEKDEYILFTYPDFNFIEEAREADTLEGESDDSTTDSEPTSYITSDSAENRPSTSSSIPSQQDGQETIVHRRSKTKKTENDDHDEVDNFVDAHGEEYSYTAVFGSDSTVIAPGRYQMFYYRSNGDVIGISDPFEISRNPDFHGFPE